MQSSNGFQFQSRHLGQHFVDKRNNLLHHGVEYVTMLDGNELLAKSRGRDEVVVVGPYDMEVTWNLASMLVIGRLFEDVEVKG